MTSKKTFGEYAKYYDLYYATKDYKGEVRFVLELAKKHGRKPVRSVLDVGCGTGGHLLEFARKGLSVRGVDQSETMIGFAKEKIRQLRSRTDVSVSVGDLRSYRDSKKYDLAVAMFAVIGYIAPAENVQKAFKTLASLVMPGGLFIFDVWYGPTVLQQSPETRIHEYRQGNKRVLRLARPELDVARQSVTVNYRILTLGPGKTAEEASERHMMRYFFDEELRLMLGNAGFEVAAVHPFLDSSRTPKLGDWNISVVARRKTSGS